MRISDWSSTCALPISDRARAGLPAAQVDEGRPQLLRIQVRSETAADLLLAVGRLAGKARPLERRGARGLLRRQASVHSRPHDRDGEEVARLLNARILAVPITTDGHPGVPGPRQAERRVGN